jgi:hypothetical protein
MHPNAPSLRSFDSVAPAGELTDETTSKFVGHLPVSLKKLKMCLG